MRALTLGKSESSRIPQSIAYAAFWDFTQPEERPRDTVTGCLARVNKRCVGVTTVLCAATSCAVTVKVFVEESAVSMASLLTRTASFSTRRLGVANVDESTARMGFRQTSPCARRHGKVGVPLADMCMDTTRSAQASCNSFLSQSFTGEAAVPKRSAKHSPV